ncbi:MAG TPA: hypothetical protein VF505_14925 [Thermoanaerobaculia bacterium]|jgi:hypothetical protein
MRRILTTTLLVAAIATTALAHNGHIHNFLGTVKSVDESHLVITTPDAKDAAFVLTSKTAYTREGKPASRTDLRSGLRVAVHVDEDGKTVTSIKIGTK